MIEEQRSDYEYKDDLIRNYIDLILHESPKLNPSENYNKDKNGAERLTSVFMELLERQFPIESPDQPLQLRMAKDYANNLSVHVNYLNRDVKEATGKPLPYIFQSASSKKQKPFYSTPNGIFLKLLTPRDFSTRLTSITFLKNKLSQALLLFA